jgi:hypothetical protein
MKKTLIIMRLMKVRFKIAFSLLFMLSFLYHSCMKDKLDFDKMSDRIEYNPSLNAPLIKGSFKIEDLVDEEDTDSVLVFRGDSIILYLEMDSVFDFDVSSVIEIPEQDPILYSITDPSPIDIVIPFDTLYSIVQDESFEIQLEHNMRIDSLLMDTGSLNMHITSSFNFAGNLQINIPAIVIDNSEFNETIPFSARTVQDFDTTVIYPLENAVIAPDNSTPGLSLIDVAFAITLDVDSGDTIKANSSTDIDFSIEGLSSFEAVFGYAGDYSFTEDTVIETDLGNIAGLSGTFAITNPKILLNYTHSFGLPIGFDMYVDGYFEDGSSVLLNPLMETIKVSPDYRFPEVSGAIEISKSTIPNIDSFLVFPPPVEIGFGITAQANPGGDTTANNFVLWDSKILLGMEVKVPLEFRANLQFKDTFKLDLDIDSTEEIDYIEYVGLSYSFRNEFPINIDADMVLHDSITDTNLDTIRLNQSEDEYFLTAAPVDTAGITSMDEVREYTGEIILTEDQIETFLNDANQLIIIAKFISFGAEAGINDVPAPVKSVLIMKNYSLDFKFNIDARIHYIKD